jgi:hypothetical protein
MQREVILQGWKRAGSKVLRLISPAAALPAPVMDPHDVNFSNSTRIDDRNHRPARNHHFNSLSPIA